MTLPLAVGRVVGIWLALCTATRAIADDAADKAAIPQTPIANAGFEDQDDQGRPAGWIFPPMLEQAGYRVSVNSDDPHTGNSSALVDATNIEPSDRAFGNLMQSVDAAPFRGQRVRFRAAVRTAELTDDGRAQLWFRVDRAPANGQNRMGAFDNMQDRPIRDDEWKHYEIVGQVDDDAVRIHVGLLVLGKGKAWIDDASLEVVSDDTPATGAALAGLTAAAPDLPQPFFVPWLVLPAAALLLFVLSQTKPGFIQRFAFRFSFAYWVLYFLPSPLSSVIPRFGYQASQMYDARVDQLVRWSAARFLGIERTLVAPNGSGDTTFAYVRLLVCFCLAIAIALVCTVVDRRKTDSRWLNDLLRSYLRYVLAFIMLGYGLAKLGSTYNQFPEPDVDLLMKSYGDSSPMNLVWTFMGSSRPYTFFSGIAEVLGAVLLIWRRTATLGALVTAGVMANVAMLNFCYDVPVKQFSAHLLVGALYLLLPDASRLAGMFLWNRPVPAADLRPPYAPGHSIWIQRAIKALLIGMGVGLPLWGAVNRELNAAGSAEQPPYFGTYEVESFSRGGEIVEPLLTDATRWRFVTLRRYPFALGAGNLRDMIQVRTMDKTTLAAQIEVSPDGLSVTQNQSPLLPNDLTIRPGEEGRIALTGTVQDQPLEVHLRRLRREDFLLVNRGFRWINEYPYNR